MKRGDSDFTYDFLADRPQLKDELVKKVAGQFSRTPADQITYEQITSNQNNYELREGFFHRLSTDASRNITGFANVRPGRFVLIANVGSFDIVITHQDAASVAQNRVLSHTAANITLNANESVFLIYDSVTARWRSLAMTGA